VNTRLRGINLRLRCPKLLLGHVILRLGGRASPKQLPLSRFQSLCLVEDGLRSEEVGFGGAQSVLLDLRIKLRHDPACGHAITDGNRAGHQLSVDPKRQVYLFLSSDMACQREALRE
jgi:hypothetical protein